jgi:hypothetical protein
MSEEASEVWDGLYQQLSSERPGMWGAACGRAEAQTIRFALIYALLESKKQIELCHLKAAMALWDYCEASAKRIFGDLLGEKDADTILLALRQNGEEGMTRTEIYHLFSNNKSSMEIASALQRLAVLGKVRQSTKYGSRGGPVEMWMAL